MKQTILNLLLALCALAGMANTARAASKTVTYTLGNDGPSTLTATPDQQCFDGGVMAKNIAISGSYSSLGINLYDNISVTLNLRDASGSNRMFVGSNGLSCNFAADIAVACTDYYITHIALKDANGTAISVYYAGGQQQTNFDFDLDVDIDKSGASGAPASVQTYHASTASTSFNIKTIAVTYGNLPSSYPIRYTNAVNGQDGVSNTNSKTYNVTTADFTITAPSRTGYTLSGMTYTDDAHANATAATLPMTISRGDAATRKAITFEASWTANTYTLRLHHNDGTGDCDEQTLTYDEADNIQSVSRTGYVFSGWTTQADGSGTSYTDGQEVTNLSATDGAVVELYAQWANPSGTCGDNATWEYDHATTTLSITGTGGTYDYDSENNERPWEQYIDNITTVSIGEGITSIGREAFFDCTNLANVTGGDDVTSIGSAAFNDTPWRTAAFQNTTAVTYLGHVAYLGCSVSGDVTIKDGTVIIAADAFKDNASITSVTLPASVKTIAYRAFYNCYALTTVNVLASTPPALSSNAFGFPMNSYPPRTFNVRSAAYKTANGWKDFSTLRVVSTLALPDGVTASVADAADKLTAYGTDYFAEGTDVTLSGCSSEVIDYGSFTARTRYVVSYNDGEARTVRYTPDANGQATFQMPAADVTVSTESYFISVDDVITYIDADGTEKTCTGFTVVGSDYEFETSGSGIYADASLGVNDATERWYVVAGTVNVDKPLWVLGNAHIILCDGAALRVNADYSSGDAFYSPGYHITIYGQTQGTGTLSVTNTSDAINVSSGMTINGGKVIATSPRNGIYINTGRNLTINRGTVTATGAIGINIREATLTQNGGTLTATGSGSYNAGIYADGGGTVSILGGTLNATGTDGAFGIYANNAAVTLGWTNAADRITVSSYHTDSGGTISVKSGQTLHDGTTTYDGTLDADQLGALNGKTLFPLIGLYAADGTAILLDDDSTQPDGYKNVDRIIALAATAGPGVPDSGINVMLMGRTLYCDGEWNTLCLPFQVNLDSDMDNILENEYHIFHGATVMELNTNNWFDSEGNRYYTAADGRHRSGEVDADGSLHLYFSKVMDGNSFWGDIAADRPYIMKWGTKDSHPATNIVNPVFHGVNFTFTSIAPRYYTTAEGLDPAAVEAFNADPEHNPEPLGNVTMRGTYAPISYAAADHSILFLGEDNTLYYPEAGAHIGAFRAYFELGNGLTVGEPGSDNGGGGQLVRAFNLGFGEGGEDTGIISASKESRSQGVADAWYTLDGVKLDGVGAGPVPARLRKGIYIHGGHKVVIK